MILLMNSAMMPAGAYGSYRYERATVDDLRQAMLNGFRSYIGYPETAALISDWTGIHVPVSREVAALAHGDVIYVVRLRYRVAPGEKGAMLGQSDPSAWEIARVVYEPSMPSLVSVLGAWQDARDAIQNVKLAVPADLSDAIADLNTAVNDMQKAVDTLLLQWRMGTQQ